MFGELFEEYNKLENSLEPLLNLEQTEWSYSVHFQPHFDFGFSKKSEHQLFVLVVKNLK